MAFIGSLSRNTIHAQLKILSYNIGCKLQLLQTPKSNYQKFSPIGDCGNAGGMMQW